MSKVLLNPARLIEQIVALLAAALCLGVTMIVWLSVSVHQPMWPFPAVYLLEMPILCGIVALACIYDVPAAANFTWIATGAVLAFSVMAAFTVGIFYAPVAVLLAAVGMISARRARRNTLVYAAWAVVAALAQTSVTYIASQLLF